MVDARDRPPGLLPPFRDAPVGWAIFWILVYFGIWTLTLYETRRWAEVRVSEHWPVVAALPVAYVLAWIAQHRSGRAKQRDEVRLCKQRVFACVLLGCLALIIGVISVGVCAALWQKGQPLRPTAYSAATTQAQNHALDIWRRFLVAFMLPYAVRAIVCVAIAVLMIFTYRKARRDLRRAEGLCEVCAYDLTGNVSGRCTECGTAITSAAAP